MRIWDIPPKYMCRKHLLGEHRELHGLWNILTQNKKGYSNHPETLRWVGKTHALYLRHEQLVEEMIKRGYNHKSDLNKEFISGQHVQNEFVDSNQDQIENIRQKGCECDIEGLISMERQASASLLR